VLVHRVVPAFARKIGHIARAAHMAVQGAVGVDQGGVAGGFDQAHVDLLIAAEIRGELAAGVVRQHLVVQRPDLGDVGIARLGAGKLARERFERARSSNISRTVAAVMGVTMAPRLGSNSTKPSDARYLIASRTGVREVRKALAQHALVQLHPGASSP